MTTTHNYGDNVIEVEEYARRVVTTLPDGQTVDAVPEDNEAYWSRAVSLGYDGPDATWEMCKDHERTHSRLAVLLGLNESPALRHAAQPDEPWNEALVDYEERVVLWLQRGWAA